VLIDWFTVIAQIANFLILVLLMRRFLYRPILNAMQTREERIAARLQEADRQQAEALAAEESYRQQKLALERSQEEILARARVEAERQRKEWVAEARAEIDETQRHWHQAIQREKELFLHELRKRAGQQVCAIARRALADLANAELEQRMVDIFIRRIQAVTPEQRADIVAAVQEAGEGITVRSAFSLPVEMRHRIRGVAEEQIGDGVEVHFDVAPDLIAGLELKAPGHRIAWSLTDYLDNLEEEIAAALEAESREWNGHEPRDVAISPG
jgi:F-type H+-transporting ATPase subunit b